MTLATDALTWNGVTIGGVDADVSLDDGIDGLGHVGGVLGGGLGDHLVTGAC
jgi:hypothetical protein